MPRPDMDMDALLTVCQAALYLGTTKQRVHRWYQLGHLKPAKIIDGVRYYRLRDVLQAERATRNSPFSNRTGHKVA